MVFSGRHGVGAPERAKHQRFGVDISIEQKPVDWQDNIDNTYNYMDARETVRKCIEEQSFKLLETLSKTIIDLILRDERVQKVTITIRKLDLIPPAVCGVTITRNR